MAQGRVYINPADHLNEYTYRVGVPAYAIRQPNEYYTEELAPLAKPFDASDRTETRMCIARLLQLFESKTPFIITRDVDVVEIFHRIDAYLEAMQTRVMDGDGQYISYCRRLVEFRKVFYRRLFLKVLNKHPDWKQAYAGEGGELTNILNIFSSVLNFNDSALNAIAELETPPIVFPAQRSVGGPTGPMDIRDQYIQNNPEPDHFGGYTPSV